MAPFAARPALLCSSLLVLGLTACGGDDSPPGSDAALLDGGQPDGATSDASASADAAPDAPPPDAGLEPGLIGPLPYLSTADSPFATLGLTTFHLEDFEDGLVNTPGLSADTASFGGDFGALVDSVDGDDDVIDGACPFGSCNSLFGGGQITLTFDAEVLGGLPTHVGGVWTDGGTACDVTFEAFDENGASLGSITAPALGDDSNLGTVGEDRFFGIYAPGGVKSMRLSNSSGGTEIDHVQYGR